MKASKRGNVGPSRGRRNGRWHDFSPRFPLLPREALAESVQAQSVLTGRVPRTSEEGPPVPGAAPHETAFPAGGAGPVVLLQERGVSDPTAERGPMGLEFGDNGVQCTTGFRHDVVEGGMALGNRGHPFFQMPSHLRTRNVGAIEG